MGLHVSYFSANQVLRGEITSRAILLSGPRPSSETALLMLADSVEAAVRADRRNISGIQDLEKVISGVVESKSGDSLTMLILL